MRERRPTAAEMIAIYDEEIGYFRNLQAVKNIPLKETKEEKTPPDEKVQDKASPGK